MVLDFGVIAKNIIYGFVDGYMKKLVHCFGVVYFLGD